MPRDLRSERVFALHTDTFANCSGDCYQGRRLCVTPAARQLPEDNDSAVNFIGWLLLAMLLVAVIGVCVVLA